MYRCIKCHMPGNGSGLHKHSFSYCSFISSCLALNTYSIAVPKICDLLNYLSIKHYLFVYLSYYKRYLKAYVMEFSKKWYEMFIKLFILSICLIIVYIYFQCYNTGVSVHYMCKGLRMNIK